MIRVGLSLGYRRLFHEASDRVSPDCFDLDHLGSEVGHDGGSGRCSSKVGELDYSYSVQGCSHKNLPALLELLKL